MNIKRTLNKVYTPPSQAGFLGLGHTARPVIQIDFAESDPFILLMDDMLDKQDDIPVGGPHPHAGFETVSLLLEGEMGEEPHVMRAGDFEMMTAGQGIVHTETISKRTKMRLLQLWLNLPQEKRHALPRVQRLESAHVPKVSSDGIDIRVYSGSFAGVISPIKNYTPVIIADIAMEPHKPMVQALPANFNTFLYVIDGSIRVGAEETVLSKDEVGWLDLYDEMTNSDLILQAGAQGARFVLYAGAPQKHAIVSHGPFIADSMEEIRQLYADFRKGKMEHITNVAGEQKLVY